MALTAKAVDAAKPNGKARKLYDGRGLFLLVQENGSRGWRFRYRWEGREKLISLGTYPEITLKDARDRRDEARRKVAHGIDPSAERQATKEARKAITESTFESVAREWHKVRSHEWSEATIDQVLGRLERDVFPWIGARPVAELEVPERLAMLRRIEERDAADTTHRIAQYCVRVLQHAMLTERAD